MRTTRIPDGGDLELAEARHQASAEAFHHLAEPMLLAWADRVTGTHSPNVECCGDGTKETWEIYAESRGASLRIEIGARYVFIFRDAAGE